MDKKFVLIALIGLITQVQAASLDLMQPIDGAKYHSNQIDFWVTSQGITTGKATLWIDGQKRFTKKIQNKDEILTGKTFELEDGSHTWKITVNANGREYTSENRSFVIKEPKPAINLEYNTSPRAQQAILQYDVTWNKEGIIKIKSGEELLLKKNHPQFMGKVTNGTLNVSEMDNPDYKLIFTSDGGTYYSKLGSEKVKTLSKNDDLELKYLLIFAVLLALIFYYLFIYEGRRWKISKMVKGFTERR